MEHFPLPLLCSPPESRATHAFEALYLPRGESAEVRFAWPRFPGEVTVERAEASVPGKQSQKLLGSRVRQWEVRGFHAVRSRRPWATVHCTRVVWRVR